MIAKKHGTFQKWVDAQVDAEVAKIKGTKSAVRGVVAQLTPKEKAKFKKVVDEMF